MITREDSYVGDRVILTGGSYKCSSYNPFYGSKLACAGTITEFFFNRVRVSWDNGKSDNYNLEDLSVCVYLTDQSKSIEVTSIW